MILNAEAAYEIGYAEFVHKQAHGNQREADAGNRGSRPEPTFSMPWKKFSIAWKT